MTASDIAGKLLLKWKQWRCEHFWRPAVIEILIDVNERSDGYQRRMNAPAKVCDYCAIEIPLSIDSFYAQFGRMPW